MIFTYDHGNHIYTINGTIVPSIHKVLAMNPIGFHLNEYKHSGKEYDGLEMAQDFGTKTHKAVENFLDGKPYVKENTAIGAEIDRMVKYAEKISKDMETVGKETPLGSEKYMFGGTPDFWGKKTFTGPGEGFSEYVIIDWKSNKKSGGDFKKQKVPEYEVQIGGQSILLKEHGFNATSGLVAHLYSGTCYPVNIEKAEAKFKKLLEVFYGKEMHNVKIKDVVSLWNSGMYLSEIKDVLPLSYAEVKEIIDSSVVF